MLFAIQALDKPDSLELRMTTRAAHLEYIKGFQAQALFLGPLQADDETMIGSLLIMDFPDRAAAEAFAAGDPYRQAGLFQSVEIRRCKKVFPVD